MLFVTGRRRLAAVCMLAIGMLCAACGSSDVGDDDSQGLLALPTPTTLGDAGTNATEPAPPAREVAPQTFVPAGPVGDAQAYDEMIDELAEHVPAELRAQVPWPDLRNPDPVVAQREIFELWIWMLENHPEPRLIDAIAAPGSPDRVAVAGIFGDLAATDELVVRRAAPYRAYDHEAITWDSAGLPLWLTRDVPEPAVVVYYRDESGPSTRISRSTGAVVGQSGSTGVREWLAVMVETDVGWRLWRDTEIDPSDAELEIPDLNKPSPKAEQDRRNV